MADIELMEELAEEPIVAEDEMESEQDEELEALRASIADLEAKEAILTEKLCLAKEKGLTVQAERCRDLLQKAILQRLRREDELKEAEARKLAAELDALTDAIAEEIDPQPITEEQLACEHNYKAKAKRLSFIAKAIRFVGLFACVVGAIVYLLLTQVETMNLPFEWSYLVIDGVAAVIFLVISLLIASSASNYKRMAEEMEDERYEIERQIAEQAAYEAMAIEHLEAATEAYSAETRQDILNATPEEETVEETVEEVVEEAPAKKKLGPITLPEIPENVKENVHKFAPLAAACTAAVATAAVISSQKRRSEERRAAATRREFFKWLG